jgi:hypothetical protein
VVEVVVQATHYPLVDGVEMVEEEVVLLVILVKDV